MALLSLMDHLCLLMMFHILGVLRILTTTAAAFLEAAHTDPCIYLVQHHIQVDLWLEMVGCMACHPWWTVTAWLCPWLTLGWAQGQGSFQRRSPKKKDVTRDNDWTCPKCGNVNFSFRTVCNMRKCNTPKPEPQAPKSADKGSKHKMPEGSWKCEKCNNINYPFRTKCNRQNCGADKPSEGDQSPSEPADDNDQWVLGHVLRRSRVVVQHCSVMVTVSHVVSSCCSSRRVSLPFSWCVSSCCTRPVRCCGLYGDAYSDALLCLPVFLAKIFQVVCGYFPIGFCATFMLLF